MDRNSRTRFAHFVRSGTVRLVRACGSKPSSVSSPTPASSVRLVRACGSKHHLQAVLFYRCLGQARKSLWIETICLLQQYCFITVRLVRACGSKPQRVYTTKHQKCGQARKSLWIETPSKLMRDEVGKLVRLVRACGSKLQLHPPVGPSPRSGS